MGMVSKAYKICDETPQLRESNGKQYYAKFLMSGYRGERFKSNHMTHCFGHDKSGRDDNGIGKVEGIEVRGTEIWGKSALDEDNEDAQKVLRGYMTGVSMEVAQYSWKPAGTYKGLPIVNITDWDIAAIASVTTPSYADAGISEFSIVLPDDCDILTEIDTAEQQEDTAVDNEAVEKLLAGFGKLQESFSALSEQVTAVPAEPAPEPVKAETANEAVNRLEMFSKLKDMGLDNADAAAVSKGEKSIDEYIDEIGSVQIQDQPMRDTLRARKDERFSLPRYVEMARHDNPSRDSQREAAHELELKERWDGEMRDNLHYLGTAPSGRFSGRLHIPVRDYFTTTAGAGSTSVSDGITETTAADWLAVLYPENNTFELMDNYTDLVDNLKFPRVVANDDSADAAVPNGWIQPSAALKVRATAELVDPDARSMDLDSITLAPKRLAAITSYTELANHQTRGTLDRMVREDLGMQFQNAMERQYLADASVSGYNTTHIAHGAYRLSGGVNTAVGTTPNRAHWVNTLKGMLDRNIYAGQIEALLSSGAWAWLMQNHDLANTYDLENQQPVTWRQNNNVPGNVGVLFMPRRMYLRAVWRFLTILVDPYSGKVGEVFLKAYLWHDGIPKSEARFGCLYTA